MSLDYQDVLKTMILAARAAGEITQAHFIRFRELEIGVKGPADFVSEADRESELLLRDHLLGAYPDWSFIGEEFAPDLRSDPEHCFLVDPIDGTTNFIFGMDYTISIALRRGSRTVAGLVYNPVRDEMFTAIAGRGAFLNAMRLSVSEHTGTHLFAVGTGLPTSNLPLYRGAYERLDAVRDPIAAVRVVGSSANSCAYVACGRLTGYFEESGLVDWAAGVLLVQEAGGIVTDWWGRGPEIYEKTGAIIAATPACHAYLLKKLAGAPQKD